MGQKTHDLDWWFFFPLIGISLTDRSHDLKKPMFGDATIISIKHIRSVLKFFGSGPLDSPTFLPDESAPIARRQIDPHSFMAVRRRGCTVDDHASPPEVTSANDRARQLASMLSVITLIATDFKAACGLTEFSHIASSRHVAFAGGGNTSLSWSSKSSRTMDGPLELHRAQLQKLLRNPALRCLSDALLPQRPILGNSVHESINRSLSIFSETLHAPSIATRVLSVVTALEIMLSGEGHTSDFKSIPRRLSGLLGKESISQMGVTEVLTARHNYVHNGLQPEKKVERKSIILLITTLLRYAEVARTIPNKNQLCLYLDMIEQSDKLSGQWSEKARAIMLAMLIHRRESYGFC